MLLAAVKAHAGFHLQISRFFQMFFSQFAIEETFCLLPYRYFNEFLVLYPISQVQGKSTYLRVPFSP